MVIILIFKFFTVFKIQEGMKKNPDFFIANAVGYALHQCYGSGFDYCLFDTVPVQKMGVKWLIQIVKHKNLKIGILAQGCLKFSV